MEIAPNIQLDLPICCPPRCLPISVVITCGRVLEWCPLEAGLRSLYPARAGEPRSLPIGLFRMSILQHCYGLGDLRFGGLKAERLLWRKFVRMGLQKGDPDETIFVWLRQWLLEVGIHGQVLWLINTLMHALRRSQSPWTEVKKASGYTNAGFAAQACQELNLARLLGPFPLSHKNLVFGGYTS